MKESKLSLGVILPWFVAILFGGICFLGCYFYTLGNITQSIITAVGVALVLAFFSRAARQLKRINRDFTFFILWEMICLFCVVLVVAYALLSVYTPFRSFAYLPFPHYFVVSANKTEIQQNLDISIKEAQSLYADYESYAKERENTYGGEIRSAVKAKQNGTSRKLYNKYVFNLDPAVHGDDNQQINDKMEYLHKQLFPASYEKKKEAFDIWVSNSKNTIAGWNPRIIVLINTLAQNSNDHISFLEKNSEVRQDGEDTENFSYSITVNDVRNHFNVPGEPTLLSIFLAMILFCAILLPYEHSLRNQKSPFLPRLRTYIFSKRKESNPYK